MRDAGGRGGGGGGGGGGGLSSCIGLDPGPCGRGRGDGRAGLGGLGARKRKALADQELKVEPSEVSTVPIASIGATQLPTATPQGLE